MPELPEVETMVRGIRPHVVGRTIRDLTACENSCKPIAIVPPIIQLQKRLIGRSFLAVRRLGKRVVFDVSDGSSLVIEPRMTGLVLLADPPDVEHLRLKLELKGRERFNTVWFWDRRGLGVVRLFESSELELRYGPKELGKDALRMTAENWEACCSKTQREVKVLLLDQRAVAGIGNLYASEILHRASINPTTKANSLKSSDLERLSQAVQSVLLQAIECEGSTLGDGTYRNALNQNGRYQNQHQAYMREGEMCYRCQKNSIVRIVQAQRSTFFCPGCQKISKK